MPTNVTQFSEDFPAISDFLPRACRPVFLDHFEQFSLFFRRISRRRGNSFSAFRYIITNPFDFRPIDKNTAPKYVEARKSHTFAWNRTLNGVSDGNSFYMRKGVLQRPPLLRTKRDLFEMFSLEYNANMAINGRRSICHANFLNQPELSVQYAAYLV